MQPEPRPNQASGLQLSTLSFLATRAFYSRARARFADDQVYSTLDRSRCFTSVPALTPDEESRLNGESHRVDNTLY